MNQTTGQPDRPLARILGDAGAVGLVAIAVARALIAWRDRAPDMPDAGPLTDLGPTALIVCDSLGIGLLLGTLAHRLLQRQRIHAALVALWLVGVIVAAVHAAAGQAAAPLAGAWIATVALALAALHLAADPLRKRIILGALVGLLIPLGLHAGHYYFIQHPQTVRSYEQNRHEFLRHRGWTPGSVEQRQFETRLYQREASGRFGLANVFGCVAGSLTLAAVGLALAARRDRALLALAVAAAALGALALALSMSKGAIAATLAVALALAIAWAAARAVRAGPWTLRLAAFALVAAAAVAVIARVGLLGVPDSPDAERSLLFRGFYWQAALRMLADHPLIGVGPGAFQQHYAVLKNPLSPEDVAAAHNVVLNWIAALGVGGLAWAAVLFAALARAARSPHPDAGTPPDERRHAARLAVLAVLLPTLVQYVVQYPELWLDTAAILLGGAVAMAAVIILTTRATLDPRPLALGLLAAATLALAHSQIDMAFTYAASAPILGVLVGLAAADPTPPPTARPRVDRLAVGLVLAASVAWPALAATRPPFVPAGQRAWQRVHALATQRTVQPDALLAALDHWLDTAPHSAPSHLHAADIAWRVGRPDTARRWYRRALDLNAHAYLAPQSQFTEPQRQRIHQRLGD